MALWVSVHGFVDQIDKLDADTLNRPVRELTERTNYLYDNLNVLLGAGVFESVVIASAALALTDTPAAGDFVYLDETTGRYTKALAAVAADTLLSANSALAVGMVLSVTGSSTGALVLYGKRTLTGVDFTGLLETGETFRNGPYYLSATEAGKMTANPSGISIYLGYFIEDSANPGYGGSAVFNPQYKGTGEAHLHRTYPMYAQPAGTQEVTGFSPTDTHSINGFNAVAAAAVGDHVSRLVLFGTWAGQFDVQYTLWLSDSSDPDEVLGSTTPPSDFSDCYLHWLSSDAEEATGCVRLWAYDTPVAVGTKGIMAALENPDTTDWDTPYTAASDSEDKRSWVLQVPEQLVGWLARHYRLYFTDHPVTDNKYSFVLFDGPITPTDGRTWDQITLKCGKLYKAAYTSTNPTDGETLTIDSTVFEFDDDDSVTAGNIAVSIGSNSNESFENLVQAIVNQELSGIDAAHNQDDLHVIISVPAAVIASTTIATVTLTSPTGGAGDFGLGTAALLVYDQYHQVLVASTSYWGSATYWTPITLKNGLQLIVIPYDGDGTPATGDTAAVGDYWDVDLYDEAPGANFMYSMGIHADMNTYYPPIPLQAGVMVLNGVDLAPYDMFPLNADYRLGMSSVYWYPDSYGNVPWSRDWIDINLPGTFTMNLLLHFVNMSAGTTGLVTSLRPAAGSPIKVMRCGTTEPATTGDLALDLDLNMAEVNSGLAGYQVVKRTNGQKLLKGPVVEKLISTDGSVLINSTAGAPNGQGVVDLAVGSFRYEGDFEEVALQNAKQELIGMFPYIRLLGWTNGALNINSAFVAKFRVPHNVGTSATKYKVIVYMTVFGETTIPWVGGGSKQYAGLKFSYSILPDFYAATPDSLPAWNSLDRNLSPSERLGMMVMGTPLQVDVPIGEYGAGPDPIYTAYDPMLIHNNPSEGADDDRRLVQVLGNPFPVEADLSYWDGAWGTPAVRPGSLVAIKVERALSASSPEYTGPLGFISIRWRLVLI